MSMPEIMEADFREGRVLFNNTFKYWWSAFEQCSQIERRSEYCYHSSYHLLKGPFRPRCMLVGPILPSC